MYTDHHLLPAKATLPLKVQMLTGQTCEVCINWMTLSRQNDQVHDSTTCRCCKAQASSTLLSAAALVQQNRLNGLKAYLLISVHEVHNTIVVVVVVHILGCVDWQHEVVGAEPVPLSVCVTEDTRL